ncbi:hypothetical protein BPLS_P0798 [Bathymodiolus platifrons methanotrophic gill symbiont]|uniref:hypothetical protein n=1 Tax=Bathymodiolus platifrons methanotrophic gill symbiont TaxID=113268 RepID=UPI0011CF00D8|nr:hypothetical protein [Bathymodiolus platifrons methanotrophic gill symbiont]TXL04257.1 hypothetical protein BMR07_12975 [Methylococcaceae bacterium CS1]GFO74243.1 hypothetical protein BPLS_P0798 [Bathymodiolus platifrons methanotrophic gill symbiont]
MKLFKVALLLTLISTQANSGHVLWPVTKPVTPSLAERSNLLKNFGGHYHAYNGFVSLNWLDCKATYLEVFVYRLATQNFDRALARANDHPDNTCNMVVIFDEDVLLPNGYWNITGPSYKEFESELKEFVDRTKMKPFIFFETLIDADGEFPTHDFGNFFG